MADLRDELVLVEVEERGGRRRQASRAAPIIDLTDEPDSPLRPSFNSRHPRPNPRRQASQRRSPPSFHRSDSRSLGPGQRHEVIDLTGDSPEQPRNPPPSPRHNRRSNIPELMLVESRRIRAPSEPRASVDHVQGAVGALFGRFWGGNGNPPEVVHFAWRSNGRLFNNHANAVVEPNSPDLDYGRPAFNHPPRPAPNFAVPPSREGFSRDTAEDTSLICPACNGELDYDPAETKPEASPSGKRRTRRDKGEHHFWAVKACGHVFCQSCFENRKPSIKNPDTGFRVNPAAPSKIICAVDHCDSEVSAKTAWVGIFL